MKKISFFLPVILCIFFLVSCSKLPEHSKYVPKNSIGVFTVDMEKLGKKMIWSVLTGSEIFDELQKDIKNEESRKAMKDVSNIGLDPNATLYFFYTGNMKDDNHPCAVAAMKDASKFESFISKNYPELKIEDNKEFKSCVIEGKYILAWNKEAALGVPITGFTPVAYDSTGAPLPEVNRAETEKTFLRTCFTLSKENTIGNLDNFKKLQKDGHDFTLWLNYEELYKQNKDLNAGELQAFIKADYFKDAALATGFNFEKGAVDMKMDYYFSKELADIYKKHIADNVSKDLLENIPSKDIAFVAAYNLKPQMIQDFMAHFKLDGIANLGLMAMGTSMESIVSTFKGDMMLALTDMKQKPVSTDTTIPDYMRDDSPDMNLTFAMAINDQAKLESLLSKGVKENLLVKNGNSYVLTGKENEGVMLYDKDRLVYSNKKELAQTFMDKKGTAKEGMPADAWKQLSNNPMALFADIKKILAVAPMESKDPEEQQVINELKNMFTYAQIYGGKMKGNANHMEGNLFFTNTEENSMVQMINLAIKAKKIEDKKKAANATVPSADSMQVQ